MGVAGGYCTGKDALVSVLEGRGFRQIDVDSLGHAALRDPEVRREIVAAFGPGVLGPDGTVDRKGLGAVVFRDRRGLRRLEAILHPRMSARVEQLLEHAGSRVVINAAILFRMGLQRHCDFVICVRAPLAARLLRAKRRDGLGPAAALRRLAAQRGICPKTNAREVDTYYVDNSRGLDWLEQQAIGILKQRGIEVA
ncbi:MAG: dephospho-CoA kinase [Spirochaetales bacterium]|nr:dephospho-CoA kinase [Spirochaetales bacterium]